MAMLVFGMNMSVDGYVDYDRFAPDPELFRYFIEQTRNTAGQLVTIYDPLTTRTENGVIVRDPFPGNVIPGDRISAVARAMLMPMPIPADGKSFNGQAILDDGPQDQETLKVDQRWTESWTMSGLYAHQHTKEPGSAFFGAHGTVPGEQGSGRAV
jgi:hypothetical protein